MSPALILGATIALILAVSLIGTLVFWACLVAGKRRDAVDDAAHDHPHGDVIHVPIGATPRSLVDPVHGGGK